MKIGNNHSDLLDSFVEKYSKNDLSSLTENYAKIADVVLGKFLDRILPIKETKVKEPYKYDDFLDKFAVKESENIIKSQAFRFFTTEANRDNCICELVLRKQADHYKLKLTHYVGSFDYAAFQSVWKFSESEKKLSQRVFKSLAYALDGIKNQHNADIKHPITIVPIIREAIKPIAESHQYRRQILAVDEIDLQQGEHDWEEAVYGTRYPEFQDENKQAMFSGDHTQQPAKRTMYTGRNSKITEEI